MRSMSRTVATTALAALVMLALIPASAGAQVVIRPLPPPPPRCAPGVPCPGACPPGVRCEGSVVVVAPDAPPQPAPPQGVVVVRPPPPPSASTGSVTIAAEPVRPIHEASRLPEDPRPPAPGLFALGYLGAWDGETVLGGAGLRFTGHLDDVYFLEVTLGGLGGPWRDERTLLEVPFHVGLRVMAPLVTPIVRIYGALATGVTLRGATGEPEIPAWGGIPIELGGGLEVGGPLEDHWAIGGFVDVRASARLPFERQDASLGVAWSAGLALMWF